MPLQVLTTRTVFDYVYDAQGNPLANVQVDVHLVFDKAQNIAPPVFLPPTHLKTTTDSTGYWQLALIPNVFITPANTYYLVKVGTLAAYAIAVPSGGTPVQSSGLVTTLVPS